MSESKEAAGATQAKAQGSTPAAAMSQQQNPLDGMPVVKHWSPSRASGAIGVVCNLVVPSVVSLMVSSMFAFAFGDGALPRSMGTFVGMVVQSAVVVVYAAVFYPSYFTERPVLKRSDNVSFANYFAGGIIFGYLWNKSIGFSQYVKRPEKGVSYIVAIACFGALALMAISNLALRLASLVLAGI